MSREVPELKTSTFQPHLELEHSQEQRDNERGYRWSLFTTLSSALGRAQQGWAHWSRFNDGVSIPAEKGVRIPEALEQRGERERSECCRSMMGRNDPKSSFWEGIPGV